METATPGCWCFTAGKDGVARECRYVSSGSIGSCIGVHDAIELCIWVLNDRHCHWRPRLVIVPGVRLGRHQEMGTWNGVGLYLKHDRDDELNEQNPFTTNCALSLRVNLNS